MGGETVLSTLLEGYYHHGKTLVTLATNYEPTTPFNQPDPVYEAISVGRASLHFWQF